MDKFSFTYHKLTLKIIFIIFGKTFLPFLFFRFYFFISKKSRQIMSDLVGNGRSIVNYNANSYFQNKRLNGSFSYDFL